MKKTVQYFSDDYLKICQDFTPEHILEFLENFRILHGSNAIAPVTPSPSKLISIKIPSDLLCVFKQQAASQGIRYQTQIKILMNEWIKTQK